MIETAARLNFPLEVKLLAAGDDAEAMTFTGYGAVFKNVDALGDVIMPGAFRAWLADVKAGRQQWPVMLSQHGGFGFGADDLTPIGVWTDIIEDDVGLKVAGKLAATPRGNEAYALLRMNPRPAINGLSIGYIPREWDVRGKPEDPRRKLKRIDVMEISLVTFPANPQARVSSVKASRPGDARELEDALREFLGYSAREAKRIVAGGWKALQRDDETDELNDLAASIRAAAADFKSA